MTLFPKPQRFDADGAFGQTRIEQQRDELLAQRDELLQALKGCMSMLIAMAHQTGIGFECLGPAHDAVAKVEAATHVE